MNRRELSQQVAEKAGLKLKDADKALNALFEAIKENVAKGEKVQLIGFGTFSQNDRKERTGFNPLTKKEIVIPARSVPTFKPGSDFKTVVNEANKKAEAKSKKANKKVKK